MNTRIMTLALALIMLLSMGACGDGAVEDPEPQGTAAQAEDVQEGGPEEQGDETLSEAAVPEWEEDESGEVADGDQ